MSGNGVRIRGAGPAGPHRVAALFLTNGAIFANLLPRYPEIKTDLHLSNAVYGAAIAAFSGGALVAGLAAATLIRGTARRGWRSSAPSASRCSLSSQASRPRR